MADETSHGEEYPGREPAGGGAQEQHPQQDAPEGQATGNAAGDRGTHGGDGGAATGTPAASGGAAGTSANEVDASAPGPDGGRQDPALLQSLDPHVAIQHPGPLDAPPAGYDPVTAPTDGAAMPPAASLPGGGPSAASTV